MAAIDATIQIQENIHRAGRYEPSEQPREAEEVCSLVSLLLSHFLIVYRKKKLNEGLEVAEPDDEPVSSGMTGLISHRREGASC